MSRAAAARSALRVAHINDTAGVATSLVAGLRDRAVECELFIQEVAAGHTYALLPKLLRISVRIRSALRIRAQLRRFRPDIVHVHYSMSALWFLGVGRPLVLHAHGTDVRPLIPSLWKRLLNRLVCRRAKRVLYSTPDLKVAIQDLGIDAAFLPNPVDFNRFAAAADRHASKDVLLFMRLNRIKGAELAVSALRRLRADRPDLTVTVIGEGELAGQLDLAPFTVLPAVAHERVRDLIVEHRVIVGQLRLGTVSLSELEAMACARPVVGRFDYADAYFDSPPLISVRTEEELRGAVEMLLDNDAKRAQLGISSAQWVRRHHSLRDVVATLLDCYHEVLRAERGEVAP